METIWIILSTAATTATIMLLLLVPVFAAVDGDAFCSREEKEMKRMGRYARSLRWEKVMKGDLQIMRQDECRPSLVSYLVEKSPKKWRTNRMMFYAFRYANNLYRY